MSVTPFYERIATEIRDRIKSGDLKPGDKLPSISELCAHYGVSTQVIRSAMLTLRAEGRSRGIRVAASSYGIEPTANGRCVASGRVRRDLLAGVVGAPSQCRNQPVRAAGY
ncbi:winged helix-turn-helix domain-containing protein [Micromonospora violae]|uniref:winged helix-turn-helix domain-containing protein n=1 Tax=Micromonospora violae TaxID=1278207 RepID=UPI0033C33068